MPILLLVANFAKHQELLALMQLCTRPIEKLEPPDKNAPPNNHCSKDCISTLGKTF